MSFSFKQGDRPLEGYTIQRGVGRGGFGEVYHALSDGGKEVALKYLRDNPQIELRGVQNCLNLKSPYLVTIYDVKQNPGGEWFVIMEYVNGPSLRDLLIESPAGMGVEKAAFLLKEIAKGLTYLHDRGIVHRDIKPGNIFYEDGYVKICDYGLSKAISPSQHSGQTMSVGTVHYMAPEVGSGNYSKTIDVYAVGVMLYEMLLGRVPYQGATMGEVLMKHLTAQPEVDQLPAPFPEVIRRALAKDPNDRFADMPSMVKAVFAQADLERSVASFEPASLSTVAAAAVRRVHQQVLVGAGGGGIGTGSSNVGRFGVDTLAAPPRIGGADRGAASDKDSAAVSGSRGSKLLDEMAPWMQGDASGAPAYFPQRSRLVAGLLGVFLGWCGAHRFYLGYTRIGIFQILLILTGVGVLWGMAEGVIILFGANFPDSLGRPLRWFDPSKRSVVVRLIFGLVGGCMLIGSTATGIAGIIAPAEFERISGPAGYGSVFVNMNQLFFAVSGGLAAFAGLAIWKASHRLGLPLWNATLRPLLMSVTATLTVLAIVYQSGFAIGTMQLVGLIVAAVAAIAFTAFWCLRGPPQPVSAEEAYWHDAWGRAFKTVKVVAILSLIVTAPGAIRYKNWLTPQGADLQPISTYRIPDIDLMYEQAGLEPPNSVAMRSDADRSAAVAEASVGDPGETIFREPRPVYGGFPLPSLMLLCLAIGAHSEVGFRRMAAGNIAEPVGQ